MDYFDDLGFIDGGIVPRCRVSLDQRFAGLYSLEFKLGGRVGPGVRGGGGPSRLTPAPSTSTARHGPRATGSTTG